MIKNNFVHLVYPYYFLRPFHDMPIYLLMAFTYDRAVDFHYMSRKEIIKASVGIGLSVVASLPDFGLPQDELDMPDFEEHWAGG